MPRVKQTALKIQICTTLQVFSMRKYNFITPFSTKERENSIPVLLEQIFT